MSKVKVLPLTTTESRPPPPAQQHNQLQESSTQLLVYLPDKAGNRPLNHATSCKGGCLFKTTVAIVRSGDTKKLAKYLSITFIKSQMVDIFAFGGDTNP